jgi:hypothetical protein
VFECEQTRIVMEERYTVCQHSTSLFSMALQSIFCVLHYTVWRYCGPLLHEFHYQQRFPVPVNSYYLSGSATFVKTLKHNALPYLWYHSEEAETILWVLWAPLNISRTHPVKNLCQFSLTDNLVTNNELNSWKFTSDIVKCSLSKIVLKNSLN